MGHLAMAASIAMTALSYDGHELFTPTQRSQ